MKDSNRKKANDQALSSTDSEVILLNCSFKLFMQLIVFVFYFTTSKEDDIASSHSDLFVEKASGTKTPSESQTTTQRNNSNQKKTGAQMLSRTDSEVIFVMFC